MLIQEGNDLSLHMVRSEFGHAIGLAKSAVIKAGPERADVAINDEVARVEGAEAHWMAWAENRADWHTERVGNMGGAAVIAKKRVAPCQSSAELANAQNSRSVICKSGQLRTELVNIRNEQNAAGDLLSDFREESLEMRDGPAAHTDTRAKMDGEDGRRVLRA